MDEHNDAPARREIKVHTEWPDQPVRGAKTLSAILLAADHAVEAWGYTARQRRGSRSATTPDRYHHAFKLDLYGVRPGHHQDALRARSPLTPAEAAVVTAAFLRQIVQEAVREIKASGYQEDAIRWCLTVPAIWDDQAMSLTRQAAVQAGLPDDPDRLCLVREPEAAALHCLVRGAYVVDSRREPAITKLPRGARYMIVDCGGGTIDISAYEVDGYRRLRQIGKMFGGTFGSEFLNRAFITEVLARRIGGIDKIADLARSHQDVLVDLADEWEKQKLTVDVVEEAGSVRVKDRLMIPLTRRVYRTLEEVVPDLERRLRESQNDADFIIVQPSEIVLIFDGVVEKILGEVDKQLAVIAERYGTTAAPEKILLVGGFAQSRYLQLRLSLRLKDRAAILVPPDGAEAVLAGAVHFCYDSALISARLSRYTYGFAICLPFEEGKDPEDSRTISEYTGQALCSSRFNRVIAISESVPVDHEYRTVVFPTKRDQSALSIQLFTSTDQDPRYVTESTGHGQVTVDISATAGGDVPGEERGVDLVFRFGGAEIAVTATERLTGRTVTEIVAFERSDGGVRSGTRRLPPWRRTGVTGERTFDHLALVGEYDKLAKDYDELVNQRLLSFAREQVDEKRQDRSLETGLWIAGFSLLLFGGELRQPREVFDSLRIDPYHRKAGSIAAIVTAARKLRTASAQASWDFTVEAGSRMRTGQQPWSRCDPQQPVRFVVAPALLIGGMPHRLQLVYTSSEPTPKPKWPPAASGSRG